MFSEVCIPLTTLCLRAPLLYIGGACSLGDHTNHVCGVATTMYRREQGLRRFGQKLDSEDDGEHPGEACQKARRRPTCAWGRPKAIHGATRSGAWPLRGIPCEGLQRGLGGSLRASRYLGTKYQSRRREFAYLYLTFYLSHLYCNLGLFFTFLA